MPLTDGREVRLESINDVGPTVRVGVARKEVLQMAVECKV